MCRENCFGPKGHILLGLQILIGGLLLVVGLYLTAKALGKFGTVGVDAGALYFVTGSFAIGVGGCLIGGIGFEFDSLFEIPFRSDEK